MIADGIGLAGQSQQICSSLRVGHHAEEWLERTGDWRCTRQGNADAQAEAIRQESNCRLHSRGVVGVAWGLAALGKQRCSGDATDQHGHSRPALVLEASSQHAVDTFLL